MAIGFSFDSLIQSLSGYGSASGNLSEMSVSGNIVKPLTDFDKYSNHVFFGDALRRLNTSLTRIKQTFPIGGSGSNVLVLSAENIFQVDQWKKESTPYDLYLLDQLSQTGSISASATNTLGETVLLPLIRRNNTQTITGSQTAIVESLSSAAIDYEEHGIEFIKQTSGSSNRYIYDPVLGGKNNEYVFSATSEVRASRDANLKNMMPNILFSGDEEAQVFERFLAAMGDSLDDIKRYIDQIPNFNTINLQDTDRTPDKFLPVLAKQFGIDLYNVSPQVGLESYFVNSTSGETYQKVNSEVWKRIVYNLIFLLKQKGTKEVVESIAGLHGIPKSFIRPHEYSIFKEGKKTKYEELLSVPTLFSTGDVYVQMPTGSVSSFDFKEDENWTIQMRVSATAATEQNLLKHPKYGIKLNSNGQAVFYTISSSLSAITTQSSLSSFIQTQDNFINVFVSKTGNIYEIRTTCLSGSGTGVTEAVALASGSYQNVLVSQENLDSSAGLSSYGTYFPVSGSFNGYMNEVRAWDVYLHEDDLKEHTRNFESVSIQSSTATPFLASLSSLKAHYKLKENRVLTGGHNFIVDSSTSNLTANPINFQNQSSKRYRIFPNTKKIAYYYPVGLAIDDDKIIQDNEVTDSKRDTGYISLSFNPLDVVNREIRNTIQNLNVIELLGNPEDLYNHKYSGKIGKLLNEVYNRMYVPNGTKHPIADLNGFIKGIENFNDVLYGLFPFLKQFLPAKTNLLSEGVFIEDHILNRHKNKRRDHTVVVFSPTGYGVANHLVPSDTGNVSAATTATFQGYREQNSTISSIPTSLTSVSVGLLGRRSSSINAPRYSSTKVGRILAVQSTPADPLGTNLELTVDRLQLSPTSNLNSVTSTLHGSVRLLSGGRAIKTEVAALRFEFPASGDGRNYFKATIGNTLDGRIRIIKNKETTFTTKIDNTEMRFELEIADFVRSLTANATASASDVGIVPIRVTNLFNNQTSVLRVVIGDQVGLVDQIRQQGGVKINS